MKRFYVIRNVFSSNIVCIALSRIATKFSSEHNEQKVNQACIFNGLIFLQTNLCCLLIRDHMSKS